MKNGKKALLLAACAVLLVVATIFGTVAYLTSTDKVNNTFTVGNVQIKLDEALVGDDGQAITGEGAARVKENDYHLLPGMTYDKDPMVTVLAGSEESFVRMLVTVNMKAELDAIFGDEGAALLDIFGGYDKDTWTYIGQEIKDNTRVYEFRYKESVGALDGEKELKPLFTEITVPADITKEQLATLVTEEGEQLTINVVAQAIQAASFVDADAAWAAFPAA